MADSSACVTPWDGDSPATEEEILRRLARDGLRS